MRHRSLLHIFGVVMAVICLAGMLVTTAQAFDGNRRGFIIGGGLGPGVTFAKQTVEQFGRSSSSNWETKPSVLADIKIGYAPSEKYQIYFFNVASMFGLDNALGGHVTISNGVGGVGMTMYSKPIAPCSYYNFGVGVASWDAVSEDDGDAWWGFGVMVGGGYEFARHWSLEGTLTYGHPTISEWGAKASTDAIAIGFKIIVLAY
jgi:hypothetical protein